MNIKYFQDTDTLYIEFKQAEVVESKDLDENTIFDLDQHGNICGITVEHASQRADIPRFSYEQIARVTDQVPVEVSSVFHLLGGVAVRHAHIGSGIYISETRS